MKKKSFCIFVVALVILIFLISSSIFAKTPSFAKKKVRIKAGDNYVLAIKHSSGKAKWHSSSNKIIKIRYKNGTKVIIQAKKPGKATVTAKVGSNTIRCNITVTKKKGIPKSLTVVVGDKVRFAQNKKKGKWETSNKDIAVVSGYAKAKTIVFKKAGTVKITEKIGKNKYICKVTVIYSNGNKTRSKDEDESESSNKYKEKMPSEMSISEIQEEMLEKINNERKKAGVSAVVLNNYLNEQAQIKAKDMYKLKSTSHYSENLGWITDQYLNANIAYENLGENLRFGLTNISGAIKGWMNSPGHKANMLSKDYTDVGIGYYKGYWVQQFGSKIIKSFQVKCPYCGMIDLEGRHQFYFSSKDSRGNIVKLLQCYGCGEYFSVCPICKGGVFVPAGIDQFGLQSSKCNKCGYQEDDVCIENCPYCGVGTLGNVGTDRFGIEFHKDSYYQEFTIFLHYCTKCNKYIVDESGVGYLNYKKKLEALLDTGDDVFNYITWYRQIEEEKEQISENEWITPITSIPMDTPRIHDLSTCIGQGRL